MLRAKLLLSEITLCCCKYSAAVLKKVLNQLMKLA
jgi:hypothetical protein